MHRVNGYTLKIASLTLILVSCYTLSPALAEKLTIEITRSDTTLNITASTFEETQSHTIDAQDMITQKLTMIYQLLDPQNTKSDTLETVNLFLKQQFKALRAFVPQSKEDAKKGSDENQIAIPDEIKALLEEVGHSVFNPIRPLMDAATSIEFVVTEDELRFPFDALFYNDSPLFLQKPVLYRFSRNIDPYLPVSKKWKGCLISDPATVPGKAVLGIKDYFPGSQHYNCRQIRYEDLQKMGPADFLLICGGGDPKGIELPEFTIRSWNLTHVQPKLVFLNVGTLGVGMDFMKAFQQNGTLYYIAPIFTYDAENASAEAMQRFFRSLSNGELPPVAMYLTRKTLYDEYLLQDNDFNRLMSRVFPYRVYRLN
jgi:hypothetical protein